MPGPNAGLVARYPDGDLAGRAIERLSRRGIDAGRISLIGQDGSDGAGARARQRTADAGTTGRLARRFGRGALLGAILGAVVGALILLAVTDVDAGVALLLGASGGAAAGAGLGALTGLQATPTMSTAWGSTFAADEQGGVVVAVACDGEAALDEVEQALAGTGAIEVRRATDLDAAGRDLGESR